MRVIINLDEQNDQTVLHGNANKDANVFHTRRDYMAGAVSKAATLEMLPGRVRNAHLNGDIHYHDLDYASQPYTNCCLPDFESMLRDGFVLGNAQVETPKSIHTAATVLSQAITAVSSAQYGGVSVESVDVLLAPYAQKSFSKHYKTAGRYGMHGTFREEYAKELTEKEIYDAMQSLEYQVNTIASTNGQTPFVTLGFGLGDSYLEREIQKAILQVRIKGLGGEGRTAIFPKLVYAIKKGHNFEPGDPNYDIKQLAVECTTKRTYPDYVSVENVESVTGDFKFPMGCRSFLQAIPSGETVGRMNLGVVTINLPRIAIEAGEPTDFWNALDARLEIAREALAWREAFVKTVKPENAPILYMEGAFGKRLNAGEDVSQLFDAGRATISLGYIGLYEVAQRMFGDKWEKNATACAFTHDVIRFMKARTLEWNNKSGGAWISLYSTPSESLADRFARMDLHKYGPIPNITDKGYYTNSFHVDSRKGTHEGFGPFEKIDFEVEYPYDGASGGFITFIEAPACEHQFNEGVVEACVDYAMEQGVAYFGVNTKVDRCFTCKFEGEIQADKEGYACPQCGETEAANMDVTRRVCGYLAQPVARPVVKGRQAEIAGRKNHL